MRISEGEPRKIFVPSCIDGIAGEFVDANLVTGDTLSPIDFELKGDEPYIDCLAGGKKIRQTLEQGGRTFVTEADDLLFVPPLRNDIPKRILKSKPGVK